MNDEMLILMVEEHPELYNKEGDDLGGNRAAASDKCMRRWTNLRERYGRELRKAKTPSGSGAQYYREWYLLDTMRFLKPHIAARQIRFSQNVCATASTSAQLSRVSQPLLVTTTTTTTTQPLPSSAMPVASPNMPVASPSPSPSAPVLPVVQQPSSSRVFETMSYGSISSPPQKTTPSQSPAIDLSQPNDQQSRASGSKKRGNTADVASSMCEAIELFKKKCIAIEEASNPAVESFGKMMTSMISKMTPLKQARAMQQMMEVAFRIQQEPE